MDSDKDRDQRTSDINAKIADLRRIPPTALISNEEKQERRRRLNNFPIRPPTRSPNQAVFSQAESKRSAASATPIFNNTIFYPKSSDYENLNKRYERSALANISSPGNEMGLVIRQKEVEPSKRRKDDGKQESGGFNIQMNRPTYQIQLQSVTFQEQNIPKPIEAEVTVPVLLPQTAQIEQVELQSSSILGERNEQQQNGGGGVNETKKNESIKPSDKNVTTSLGLFAGSTKPGILSNKTIQPLPRDKKVQFNFISQKLQPSQPIQAELVAAQQMSQPETYRQVTQLQKPDSNLSLQNDSQKPELQVPPLGTSQAGLLNASNQASLKKKIFSNNLPNPSFIGQPQTIQKQKKPQLQRSFQTNINNSIATTNAVQKSKTFLFNETKQPDKPFLGGNNVNLFYQPKPPTVIFPIKTQSEKAPIDAKPSFTPSFFPKLDPVVPVEIKNQGFFSKKTTFGQLQTNKVPQVQGGLFSNTTNDPMKLEQKPKNDPTIMPMQQAAQVQSEKSENKQKLNLSTAMGPGGKTIEIKPLLFAGETKKSNIFSSNNGTPNLFTQPATSNLFQTSSNNIFGANNETPGFFSQQTLLGDANTLPNNGATSLFGGNTLFGSKPTNNLFGNGTTSLFGTGDNGGNRQEEQEGEEEDENGLVVAKDDANPSLSTGTYQYNENHVYFKEPANKIRVFNKDPIENIVISIQSGKNSQQRWIFVWIPNKTASYSGLLLKDFTTCRPLNGSNRNVEIQKIVTPPKENNQQKKLGGFSMKIQFKDDSIGNKFMREVALALGTA